MIAYSFVAFLVLFVLVGLLSVRKKKNNTDDYYLASRSIPAWLAGLSAGSTTLNGGFMLGVTGLIYLKGVSILWLPAGILLGLLTFLPVVGKKVANFSHKHNFSSFTEIISKGTGKDYKYLRYLIGISVFVMLGVFGSVQILSGGKALNSMLGLDFNLGAFIISGVILLYCLAGGMRASIWTDAAQALVMIGASLTLLVIGIVEIGGFKELFKTLETVDPNFLSFTSPNMTYGILLFFLGWISASVLFLGLPHVMVRFMTLKNAKDSNKASFYYFLFYIITVVSCIATAFIARALIPLKAGFDIEIALPTLANMLLPPVLIGAFLASIFAALLSTSDSIVLAISSTITKDIFPRFSNSYFVAKVTTVVVTILALILAIYGHKNIFNLILFAITGTGIMMAPILVSYLFGYYLKQKLAITMSLSGFATLILWKFFGNAGAVNEALPAIIVVGCVFLIGKTLGLAPKEIEK